MIELTERERVADLAALRETLDAWVSRGAHVAVDDTGAGYASIGAVLDLEPHFVKVAREIVAGVDRDPRRRRVIAFLVAYATDAGATLVAEGVERVEELIALRDLGVACAQGYLLARPNPPWPEPSAAPWSVDPAVAAIPGLADGPATRAPPATRCSPSSPSATSCSRASTSSAAGCCAARACTATGSSWTACRPGPA